jgi:hypothetical protein
MGIKKTRDKSGEKPKKSTFGKLNFSCFRNSSAI